MITWSLNRIPVDLSPMPIYYPTGATCMASPRKPSALIRHVISTSLRATRHSSTFACTRGMTFKLPMNSGNGLTSFPRNFPRMVASSCFPAGNGRAIPGLVATGTCYTCTKVARYIAPRMHWSMICPMSKATQPRPAIYSKH